MVEREGLRRRMVGGKAENQCLQTDGTVNLLGTITLTQKLAGFPSNRFNQTRILQRQLNRSNR